ncbi:hypothetical protein BGZ83_005452 [Gryganskiella cystojenkinii]|nr:hypothetical protein BGZ83_005452 [Gryganskiella cystojenkinii]
MTRLLSFTYFGHGVDYLENQSPSSKYNTVRQAQVYGVLHYSSQLRELSLDIDIDDLRDTQLLAAAISRMLNLQKLRVESLRYDWSGNKFIPTIVECCPSSLVDLIIDFHTFSDDDPLDFGAKTEEEKAAEVESVRFCMPLLWEENGVSVIPRQGQLDRLHRLVARQLGQLTIDEIFSVFKQCPNLTKFFGPELSKDIDPLDVAMCIGRHCQKVNWLAQAGSRNPMLLMDIMDALSTQTVEVFFFHTFDKSSVDLASRILRHSGSLREIRLENCQEFNSRAIQTILVHCHALEEFICQGRCNDWEMKFDLADAIEFPWGSTRLKCLHLLIAMDHIEPTPEGPFYERVPPINLTDAEDIQMSMLKKLYHQIGRLVDMEVLTMRLIVRKYPPAFPTTILFPGMWSLPRGNSGQLGYLHLFASLKKLRVFISNMDSDKTIKLIGQPEVEWIAHNWPSLQRIDFFRNPRSRHPASPPKPSCFQWLKEQMPQLKMD